MIAHTQTLGHYQDLIRYLIEDCHDQAAVTLALSEPKFKAVANEKLLEILRAQARLTGQMAEQGNSQMAQLSGLFTQKAQFVAVALGLSLDESKPAPSPPAQVYENIAAAEAVQPSTTGLVELPDHQHVQPFSRQMIERFLKSMHGKFLRDSDGDFVIQFGYREEWDSEMTMYLQVAGSDKEILVCRAISDKRILRNHWEQVIFMCNLWNMQHRWPKAFLHFDDPQTSKYGLVMVEEQFDLEEGVHQALLEHILGVFMATTFRFLKWAHVEQNL